MGLLLYVASLLDCFPSPGRSGVHAFAYLGLLPVRHNYPRGKRRPDAYRANRGEGRFLHSCSDAVTDVSSEVSGRNRTARERRERREGRGSETGVGFARGTVGVLRPYL